jgi:hypothetical protein
VATPRVVASLAPAGSAVRVSVDLERDGARETIRNVKASDLWTALKELLVLRTLHEKAGARSLDLSLDPAVVNQALSTAAVEKVLASNHLHSVDVAFSDDGIVLGVVPKLGPLKLPRRRYTIGVAARRGAVEFDLTEILAIPVAGSKIAAVIDTKAQELDWISVRRKSHLLTIGYRQLRCERVASEDDVLHVTLSAAEPPRGARSKPRA